MDPKVYFERGRPVRVLIRWSGKGPRNVLIEREDGARVVRPFRGLRKEKSQAQGLGRKGGGNATAPTSYHSNDPCKGGGMTPQESASMLERVLSAQTAVNRVLDAAADHDIKKAEAMTRELISSARKLQNWFNERLCAGQQQPEQDEDNHDNGKPVAIGQSEKQVDEGAADEQGEQGAHD